ncbi:MAG: hypothetical protein CL678_16720 [Bdellovibrionaceae bacterium]|nr:hypothetical protein [Pseudobdellovibrionaceae bacterium]
MWALTLAGISLYAYRQVFCEDSPYWDRVAAGLYFAGISTVYVPPGFLGVPMFLGTSAVGQSLRPGVYAVSPVVATTLLPYSVPKTLERSCWPRPLRCNTYDGAELQWPSVRVRWAVSNRELAVQLVNEFKTEQSIDEFVRGEIDAAIRQVCFLNTERTLLTTDAAGKVNTVLNTELARRGLQVKSVRWVEGAVRPTNAEANAFYNTLPFKQSHAFKSVASEQADWDSKTVAPKFMAVNPPWVINATA